jgi:hypothetical protein
LVLFSCAQTGCFSAAAAIRTLPAVQQVASRLAVILACVYALLLLIVLVNLLIAIVDET